jgi:hypothetical protein
MGRYLNPGSPEYEAGGLTTRPRLLVSLDSTNFSSGYVVV